MKHQLLAAFDWAIVVNAVVAIVSAILGHKKGKKAGKKEQADQTGTNVRP